MDTTVTCVTGASGFSCKGAAAPDATTLLCSEPTLTATGADYCCLPVATGTLTCTQDQAVVCTAGNYGFTCTSANTPMTEYPGLTCSTGTAAAGGATEYCCH
jgi:hypothetical protein